MTNIKYQYIFEKNITKEKHIIKSYINLPLIIDVAFNDLKNSQSFNLPLIDPFINYFNKNSDTINKICADIFNGEIVNQDNQFYLNSFTNKKINILKKIDKVILIMFFELYNNNDKIIINLSKQNIEEMPPFYIHEFLKNHIKSNKYISIIFISDDADWISIFDNDIKINDIFWVEGEIDLFTYKYFIPKNEYKIARGWLNILNILKRNNKYHYGIIDKDGFKIDIKKDFSKLYLSKYSECENIWLSEKIINIFNSHIKKFSGEIFIKDLIKLANDDKNETFERFLRRQINQKNLDLPYYNAEEIDIIFRKYEKDLFDENYEEIIKFYDNKTVFNLLLKRLSCKNIAMFYNLVLKYQKEIKSLNINPIT